MTTVFNDGSPFEAGMTLFAIVNNLPVILRDCEMDINNDVISDGVTYLSVWEDPVELRKSLALEHKGQVATFVQDFDQRRLPFTTIGSADYKQARRISGNGFAAGFVVGQMEKIKVGACPAGMIKPKPHKFDEMDSMVVALAAIYGLTVARFAGEIWFHKGAASLIQDMRNATVGTPAYRTARKTLAGSITEIGD